MKLGHHHAIEGTSVGASNRLGQNFDSGYGHQIVVEGHQLNAAQTDVFYFASPKIMANLSEPFDSNLFDNYVDFFVRPLPAILGMLKEHLDENFSFYWPSTSFLDEPEPGFKEYAAAKAEGEAYCRSLAADAPKAHFSTPRLPRMRTDQTQSLIPLAVADPVQVLGDLFEQGLPVQVPDDRVVSFEEQP